MNDITFRLTNSSDPEERLEEACVWKALYDVTKGQAKLVTDDTPTTFGRLFKNEPEAPLEYWKDPAFLKHVERDFLVCDVNHACREVKRLHDNGKGAFVKSTRPKHAIFQCPVGRSLEEEMESMIYSFIDGGPLLMVQEHVSMAFEWRYFVINRKIVTDSNNHPSLIPLDFPFYDHAYMYTSAEEPWPWAAQGTRERLWPLIEEVAATMKNPTAVVDLAIIKGVPACVEFNPFRLGQVGLFACNVRALVKASVEDYQRNKGRV